MSIQYHMHSADGRQRHAQAPAIESRRDDQQFQQAF
jgi:hypothetical protein